MIFRLLDASYNAVFQQFFSDLSFICTSFGVKHTSFMHTLRAFQPCLILACISSAKTFLQFIVVRSSFRRPCGFISRELQLCYQLSWPRHSQNTVKSITTKRTPKSEECAGSNQQAEMLTDHIVTCSPFTGDQLPFSGVSHLRDRQGQ